MGHVCVFVLVSHRSPNAPYNDTFDMEPPWHSEPHFVKKLLHEEGRKASFLKVDAFHTVSLGIAKNFAAGALALLQALVRGSSIEERLKIITSDYLEFCKEARPQE